ncbi:family 16 glycosylhydrolase [Hyphomonas johnsonii]|uniref:family 16 glycosylhydrolase n=1 Tax=Hyphomonas johnsonii TaxID=81031 RepID=UPI00138E4879|nr:family 16 glycosylhydrolase [Hyphomonas johnsonii]
MAAIVAVCSFGIWLLTPSPTGKHVEPSAQTVLASALVDPHDPAPEATVGPTETVPAIPSPAPPRRTILIKPRPPVPVISKSPGFITLLGDAQNDAFFYQSSYSNPTGHYGGDWSPRNITNTAEGADLEVRRTPSRSGPFTGAEMKTLKTYGYGRYEVVMRPAKGSGLVSSFFTYTGAYQGTAHDEIDIEFLGKDTSRVHFNYFRKGRRGEFATFDLPFDAAEADHVYAFEWTPDRITWFVDGKPYYSTPAGDKRLPKTAGNIVFNAWTGKPDMQGWHGKPDFESGAAAHYSCVSFSPYGQESRSCSDLFLPQRPIENAPMTADISHIPTR